MEIIRGKLNKPKKVVIYGTEGIGKTTLAAQFPDPLFIDTEGSTNDYDVARLPEPTSYELLKSQINWVIKNRPCRTLVIDTMDWAEKLVIRSVCANADKGSIEGFGYGKGYTYVSEEMGRLLNLLDLVIDAGIHVVVTAHAALRKVEQPDEMGSYDKWEMKLSKQCAPLLKEWADMILFCNYKTYIVKEDDKAKKGKAQGGRRVMYTSHNPCWDAKNRYGLPNEMDMSYDGIRAVFESNTGTPAAPPAPVAPPVPSVPPAPVAAPEPPVMDGAPAPDLAPVPGGIPKALADLMTEHRVDEEEIQAVVAQKGYFPADMPVADYPPDFIDGVLIGAWEQVFDCIINNRPVPF